MREIKFRAWNPADRIMTAPITIAELLNAKPYFNEKLRARLIWLQFTGLHDKNGKEIYEGDILKTSTGNDQVLWDGKDGLWCFNERVPLYFASINQREVIGNIYENPELLNDN